MKIKNTTDLNNDKIREIIKFCKPNNITNFDVMIKNGKELAGSAYCKGSSYHCTSNPFIVCRLPSKYPRTLITYQIGQFKDKKYYLIDKIEALVYLSSHELKHLWQNKVKKGWRAFGSKGQFSEIDTESYAIRKLREYRSLKKQKNENCEQVWYPFDSQDLFI